MAGTFSQIYIHVVFSPMGHENVIRENWSIELFRYISGIIKNKGQKLIAINGMPDHIHIFLGIKPSIALSDLIRDIKNNSTNFINKRRFVKGKFSWQEGFGAFSHSHSQINTVYQYILNQKEHHIKRSFRDEYLDLLKKCDVDFDERFLFKWI